MLVGFCRSTKSGDRIVEEIKVIEVNEDIFASNDKTANETREKLKKSKTFMLNVMSSPGSGKTTLLSAVINKLKSEMKIIVFDVDIETSLDATTVAKNTGVKAVQIHNGGLCHIDADMTSRCLENINLNDYDLIVLENIGNLVCPAEFDTGACKNMMLLSVPEGDDKPLKYPLMFSVSDIVVFSKIDTKSIFDFDAKKCKERIKKLNKNAKIVSVSAKTGEGIDELVSLLKQEINDWKKGE